MHPSKGPCSNLKHFIYGEGNGDWSCLHHSVQKSHLDSKSTLIFLFEVLIMEGT